MPTNRANAVTLFLVAAYFLACAVVCSPPAAAAQAGENLVALPPDQPGYAQANQRAFFEAMAGREASARTRFADAAQPPPSPEDVPAVILPAAAPEPVAVDISSYRPCPDILCVQMATAAPAGAGPASPGYRLPDLETLVFDLRGGRAIEITDVLRPSPEAVARVSDLACARLTEALGVTGERELAAVQQATGPYAGNFARFGLDADSIVFYFPPSHLGAWATGTAEIRIPYIELLEALDIRVGWTHRDGIAVCEYIEVGGAVSRGWDGLQPMVALTFDDGPHPEYTRLVLEELSRHHAVATFCVIGLHAKLYPEVLREIVLQGSEIGNHTWSHQDLTKLPPAAIAADVERAQRFIETVTGRRPTFLRPPAGAVSRKVVKASGLPLVTWSVDPKDWLGGDAASVAAHIIERANGGDIILQHDSHSTSYEALGAILDGLAAKGYRFVTVSELLGLGGTESPRTGFWSCFRPL